jgi:hypothetical protein
MAATIPTTEPAQLRAGETLHFLKSLADYPASSGWSITYSFRGLNLSAIDFTTSANGVNHEATVAFATTTQWLAGTYQGVGIVSDGTTKTQIWAGQLIVLPNVAALSEGADTRSQARRTLDNINAVIEGRASSAVLNSTVEGTTLQRIPVTDLLMLRDRYVKIVFTEEEQDRIAQGKPSRRNIYTRFSAIP